jgi:type VI secretion system ImpM family protein
MSRSAGGAAFGKLPWAGDFLSVGDNSYAESLRSWVEQGNAVGAARGEAWKHTFDHGAQKAFVVPLTAQSIAVGVLAPSRDEVGRRFPFLVFAGSDVGPLLKAPHVLPLYLASFLQAAGEGIFSLASAERRDVGDVVGGLALPEPAYFEPVLDSYSSWVQSSSLRSIGQAIFGGEWREALGHALFVCLESIRPFYGQETPPTPLAVRLPVGIGSGGAASFWLHVVRSVAGWTSTIPACFWSFEPSGAAITVFFGSLQPSAFADLWEAHPDADNLSDLTGADVRLAGHLKSARPELARLMTDEGASIADLLFALAQPPR